MITVFSQPNCMQCRMTYRAFDAKGIAYEVVDVTTNPGALAYVKDELGYLSAPVVVVSEHDHWTGFQPDQINRVAATGGTGSEELAK